VSGAAGTRSFDHRDVANLPEYAALGIAVRALFDALMKRDGKVNVPEWRRLLDDLARGQLYLDLCDAARYADCDVIGAPYIAEINDHWLAGTYRCPRHGDWTCGYAVDAWEMI
jgi:hypothetical protein